MVRSGLRIILTGMHTRARVALATTSAALLAVLAGCGDTEPAPEIGTIRTAPPEAPEQQPEPELQPAEPIAVADCPYLSAAEASGQGGELVTEVRIDDSLDPVACFFFTADGTLTLTTTVHTVDSADRAAELVAESAPAGIAEPLTVDGGWTGGVVESLGGGLAVLARGDQILAVQSVSEQVDPAREIAELVGPRLAG